MDVRAVTDRLVAAGCVAAGEEAGELVAAAPDDATLEQWLGRRERGEPLAWITGRMVFCGHEVHVAPGVYVPRWQTEQLAVRAATALREAAGAAAAVDLCTGAGAIAVHLRATMPGARIVGVDVERRAAQCAHTNGVPVVVGDLDAPFQPGAVDVVTAVPPYVPTAELRHLPADVQRYEPRRALDGGDDGLDIARRVVAAAARLLRPGGWLFIEVGGEQDEQLQPALDAAGFADTEPWFDEDGDLRGLAAATGCSQ